jgi:hypothetical protein
MNPLPTDPSGRLQPKLPPKPRSPFRFIYFMTPTQNETKRRKPSPPFTLFLPGSSRSGTCFQGRQLRSRHAPRAVTTAGAALCRWRGHPATARGACLLRSRFLFFMLSGRQTLHSSRPAGYHGVVETAALPFGEGRYADLATTDAPRAWLGHGCTFCFPQKVADGFPSRSHLSAAFSPSRSLK